MMAKRTRKIEIEKTCFHYLPLANEHLTANHANFLGTRVGCGLVYATGERVFFGFKDDHFTAAWPSVVIPPFSFPVTAACRLDNGVQWPEGAKDNREVHINTGFY